MFKYKEFKFTEYSLAKKLQKEIKKKYGYPPVIYKINRIGRREYIVIKPGNLTRT
jgi:hypothetical protein